MHLYPPLTHDLIRANAGTGKTFQLTNRVIHLLVTGFSADSILATTFTRKAASEIRERVFKRLLNAVTSAAGCSRLAEELQLPSLTVDRCREVFLALLQTQHRLRIGTIDAFFMEIARLFFLESGLPPEWKVCSVAEEQIVFQEALLGVLEELGEQGDLVGRCATILGSRAPALLLRPLTRHLRPVMETARSSEPSAWEEPLVTSDHPPFGAQAEALMAMSLPTTKAKPPAPLALWVKARDQLIDYCRAHDAASVLQATIVRNVLDGKDSYARAPYTDEHQAILRSLAEAATATILINTSLRTKELRQFVDAVQRAIDLLKFRDNTYSFDDVKHILRYASDRFTELDLFFRLDTRLRHILIDEFQDTSLDQWTVMEPLVTEILAAAPGERTFLCVGDEKQSIYDWRGGTPHLFDLLEERFTTLTPKPLYQSYRSSPVIMAFTNVILTKAPHCPALVARPRASAEWVKRHSNHESVLTISGYVQLERVDSSEGDDDDEQVQATPEISRAVALVQEIRCTNPTASIGILLRRNKFQSELLAQLRVLGIQASGEGGTPLTSSPMVRALLALLKWIEHPSDTIASFHVLQSPLRDAFQGLEEQGEHYREFLSVQRNLLWRRGMGAFLAGVVAEVGVESAVESSLLDHFLEAAYRFDDESHLPDVDRFLLEVEHLAVPLESQSEVRVMTIHKAKGLEFDAVVLLDLEQPALARRGVSVLTRRSGPLEPPTGVWIRPIGQVVEQHPTLREAAREDEEQALSGQLALLYVAITRPRHALYILLGKSVKPTSLNEILTQSLEIDSDTIGKLYEIGDPNWRCDDRPATEGATAGGAEAERLVSSPLFLPTQFPLRRALLAQTPSTRPLTASFGDLLEVGSGRGMSFGVAVHALCEQIEWLTSDDRLVLLDGESSIVSYLHERLTIPEIRAAFDYDLLGQRLGGELELWRERAFALRLSEKVVSGTFDRVVVARSPSGLPVRAVIIDFKTDRCEASEVATHAAAYYHQMSLYRASLSTMLDIPESSVECDLLFLHPGVCVTVCNG